MKIRKMTEEEKRKIESLYEDATIYLDRKYSVYKLSCGHIKQEELLGTPTLERQKEDNQQPSLLSNEFEGSTTNSRILNKDSNGDTSILQSINLD